MGWVLHDKDGYVCDLSSAQGCRDLMSWLAIEVPSPVVLKFVHECRTTHPGHVAEEVDLLLRSRPPPPRRWIQMLQILPGRLSKDFGGRKAMRS